MQFQNLKKGVYDVVVKQNNKKVGESIINVSGSTSVLLLGINLDNQKNNPLLKDTNNIFPQVTSSPYFAIGALIAGIIMGVVFSLALIKLFKKKRHKKDEL